MNIFIITEGFQKTGYGHLTRCQSIYQAFETLGIMPKMIVNGDDNAKMILKNQDCLFFDWLNDNKKLFNKIRNADIAIIDSYLAGISLYTQIADLVKTPVYIDDNIRLNYLKGIVVNGSIGAEKFPYPKETGKTYLLGVKYQPMRKAFWDIHERKINKKVENVLLTMGGTDLRNLTPKIQNLLTSEFPDLKKQIVIGSGFNNIKEIEKNKDDNTTLHYNLDDKGMKQLMMDCDIAISAAGQTLYELAATQTPTIAIGVADNQKNNIEGWLNIEVIRFAGWWNSNEIFDNINQKLRAFANNKNNNCINKKNKLFKDTKYLAKKIMLEYTNRKIEIRKASIEDMKNVFLLSNNPEVRANSINKETIQWENHVKWFSDKISCQETRYFIAYEDDKFVGQVRYDPDSNPNSKIVSISIEDDFRNRGIAAKLLRETAFRIFDNKQSDMVIAYIKPDNKPSIRLFEKVGYMYKTQTSINKETYFTYELTRNKIQ